MRWHFCLSNSVMEIRGKEGLVHMTTFADTTEVEVQCSLLYKTGVQVVCISRY